MIVHYLELVVEDVDAAIDVYQAAHGVEFGPPQADLGNARVASKVDGTTVGIRSPLAEHETPIVRTYLAVDDIQAAVSRAEAAGGQVAYPPTRQGEAGMFAIVMHGGLQHGFWQR